MSVYRFITTYHFVSRNEWICTYLVFRAPRASVSELFKARAAITVEESRRLKM